MDIESATQKEIIRHWEELGLRLGWIGFTMSFLALEGLHVFVTGAAGGIGSAIVDEFLGTSCLSCFGLIWGVGEEIFWLVSLKGECLSIGQQRVVNITASILHRRKIDASTDCLPAQGCKVTAHDIRPNPLSSASNSNLNCLQGDISDEASIADSIAQAAKAFGQPINILCA
jgi:hypothetical protein